MPLSSEYKLHLTLKKSGSSRIASVQLMGSTSQSCLHRRRARSTSTTNISFSIVLLALVDANYRFLYVDIGSCGRVSDGGVYNNSSLAKALTNNTLDIPNKTHLPGSDIIAPSVTVADVAFALKTHQMKPYSFRHLTKHLA